MCQFFSCIIEKQNYEVVYDTQIDDHETLIKQAKLVDDTNDPEKLKFARVEIVPPNNDVFEKDFKKWTLKIDEKIIPEWFNPQCEENCFKALKECLAKVVIDGNPIVTEIIDGRVFNKNSKIVCRGNTQSENWGNAHSMNYDNAHSMNYGNAHSMNRDNTQSENYDNTQSENYDNAHSMNYGNAHSMNYDNAHSMNRGNAQSENYDNAHSMNRGNAHSMNYDNAHSMNRGNAQSENYDNAHSMNYDSAHSMNYGNAHSMNRDNTQSENYDNAQSVNRDSAQSVLKSPCAIAIYPEKNKIVILKTSKYKLIKEKP